MLGMTLVPTNLIHLNVESEKIKKNPELGKQYVMPRNQLKRYEKDTIFTNAHSRLLHFCLFFLRIVVVRSCNSFALYERHGTWCCMAGSIYHAPGLSSTSVDRQ